MAKLKDIPRPWLRRYPGVLTGALSKFGSEPLGGTPQEFAGFVASESRKWSKIIRLSGVKVE